jgi:hypothetical protein
MFNPVCQVRDNRLLYGPSLNREYGDLHCCGRQAHPKHLEQMTAWQKRIF